LLCLVRLAQDQAALPLLRAARQLARHTDKAVPLKTAYFRFRYYSGKTLTLWEIYLL